jgi:hypothetical protein
MEYFYSTKEGYDRSSIYLWSNMIWEREVWLLHYATKEYNKCKKRKPEENTRMPNGACKECKCFTVILRKNCIEFELYTLVTCGGPCRNTVCGCEEEADCSTKLLIKYILEDKERTSI